MPTTEDNVYLYTQHRWSRGQNALQAYCESGLALYKSPRRDMVANLYARWNFKTPLHRQAVDYRPPAMPRNITQSRGELRSRRMQRNTTAPATLWYALLKPFNDISSWRLSRLRLRQPYPGTQNKWKKTDQLQVEPYPWDDERTAGKEEHDPGGGHFVDWSFIHWIAGTVQYPFPSLPGKPAHTWIKGCVVDVVSCHLLQ